MNSKTYISGIAVVLLLVATATVAAEALSEHVKNVVEYDGRSERDQKRDQTSNPTEILTFAGIEPGMVVLDLFAGGGYWSELFSRAVGPSGKVVAHTNTAFRNFAGKLADARFADKRLANVDILLTEMNDLGLGRQRFDLIFIGLVYHDIYFHADFWPQPGRDYFLAQLYDALKPTGRLVIIDHVAKDGTGPTHAQSLHRIDKVFARKDIESGGFIFDAESAALVNANDNHTLDVFDDQIRRRTDRFVYKFKKQK